MQLWSHPLPSIYSYKQNISLSVIKIEEEEEERNGESILGGFSSCSKLSFFRMEQSPRTNLQALLWYTSLQGI